MWRLWHIFSQNSSHIFFGSHIFLGGCFFLNFVVFGGDDPQEELGKFVSG